MVTFASKEVRDAVRGAAYRLANCPHPAGIRLEVPDYLQKNFRALENIAYQIKQKNPHLKRNVKLDELRMDVVMDIQIKDRDDWKTVLPEHAEQAARARPQRPDTRGASRAPICPDELSSLFGDDSEEDSNME